MEKQNVFEIIKIILLGLLVLIVGYTGLQLKPDGRPWPRPPKEMLKENGLLKESRSLPPKGLKIHGTLDRILCDLELLIEMQNKEIEILNRTVRR